MSYRIEITNTDTEVVAWTIDISADEVASDTDLPADYGPGQRALAIAAATYAPSCPWDCDHCRED